MTVIGRRMAKVIGFMDGFFGEKETTGQFPAIIPRVREGEAANS